MTRVLFDMHTVVANGFTGKFKITRFAECLARDPAYDVHVVYDRADGATIPVPYEFLRQWYFRQWGGLELRLRWAACLARTDADWLWTQIVPGHHSANPRWMPAQFGSENTVLHVDVQHQDIQNQARKIRRHSKFHVLTQVQRDDLIAELGVDRDQVHVIPNPVDIPQFRQDEPKRDGTILYVDGRESNLEVLYRRLLTPEHRRRLRVIDADHRVSQEEYVRLLNSASIAICLTPSGDSTTTRLFEFAAAGLPFVTWRSRGMEPLLPSGSYGDLLDDDSVQWTLDNQESLSKNLKRESEQFSYEATLIRMQGMFR